MELRARDPVPALTAILTIVSLALVFGAVLGAFPSGALPRASDGFIDMIPHLNAVISTTAIVTIAAGWAFIRRGQIRRHQAMMVSSLGLFIGFLALYLYRLTIEGTKQFPGPDGVYQFVYLPTLAIHILLAIVCLPLVYYVLLLALTRPIAELRNTRHATVGRVAAGLWLVSFFLGDVVYVLLYVVY